MTTYRIPAPDGKTYRIEGPEGATQEQIQAEVIRQNPHLAGATAPTGVAAIPTEPGANLTPTPEVKRPWYETVARKGLGGLDTAAAIGAGLISAPVSQAAGIGANLVSGKYGTPEGIRLAEKTAGEVQKSFYQPRSEEAQRNLGAIGNALAPVMGVAPNLTVMTELGRAAAPAVRAAGDLNRAVAKAPLPMGMTLEQQAAERVANSYRDAGRIEAAKAGNAIGLVGDPGAMNPTRGTKVMSRATDPKLVTAAAAKSNDLQLPIIAKKEMGLPENTSLNSKVPFDDARKLASGSYEEISKIPLLTADADTVAAINNLKPSEIAGRTADAAKAAAEIDLVIADLQNGISGKKAINTISAFRKDAQSIFNSEKLGTPLTSAQRDMAVAYKAMADKLEDMIAANLKEDPRFAARFNADRTQQAKINAYEDATNFGTGKIDPTVLAKHTKDNPNLTGDIATIGKFTNNFPEAMGIVTPENWVGAGVRHLSRASVSGTIGAGIGALTPIGPIGGGALGFGVGAGLSHWNAQRMTRPGYQAANAIPTDYRPAVNNLRPVNPNMTTNSMVPFDYANATAPNWVPGGRGPQGPTMVPNVGSGYPELPAPSAQSTLGAVAAENARRAAMSRTLGQQAEAQQAAAEAAGRPPTSGAVILERDPVTGTFSVGAEAGKGLTPDIQVIQSTGANLSAAADILASGKAPALLTPEQRIAWNKTKVDIAEAGKGYAALSDKALAAKMQDRAWVQEALTKAQDKARAFQDIAARAANERIRQAALVKREQMMDLVEQLQDTLGRARPVSGSSQGPKTRAAQRNALAPESQNQLGQ